VVVLDGDGYLTGVSMAEILALRGKRVTLVTNMNNIAEFSRFTMEMPNNKRMLHERDIRVLTNHWAHSFPGRELSLYFLYRDTAGLYELEPGHWGRRAGTSVTSIPCSALILVTSRVSNGALYAELKQRQSEWTANDIQAVYRIGDCHAPRHALNAIFDGHRLAREFESPHPQQPLPFIRERQVWGSATFPKLGDPRPQVEVI
jgi:dimethylamine/trimethylamine dehydrogenase